MSRALFRLAVNHIKKSCQPKPRLRRTNQFFEPRAAVLEARQLLSASVIDVPRGEGFLYNPAGVLSDPSTASREQIAINFLQANYSKLGLTASDVSNLTVTSQYTEGRMSHVYLRQTYQNIQVMSADISVTMLTNGSVLAVGSQLVNGLSSRIVSGTATFSAQSAIGSVANYFNQIIPTSDHISVANTTAQLAYVPGDDGRLHLAWNLQISSADGTFIGNLFVDAREGTIVKGLDEDKLAYLADEAFNPSGTTATNANRASGAVAFNSTTGEGTYRVFALPTQAPNDGSRVLVVAPADNTYSPYGWHDEDGIAGAEYTITKGNNAETRLNRFDDILGYGYQTDGGVDLNFDFSLDLTQDPLNSYDAALTQAFYTVNMAHDIFAYYGFTEAAGNFQHTNYTGQGAGWDAVLIDVQTTTTFNNAIFFSSPDGSPPRMRLFLYNKTDPYRDIAFDNTVIVHEYGHGVTKRLTGGANNIDVLDRPQSGSMGEGWSDFFALMLTQKATDTKYETYGVGTYVYGQETNEAGGRRQPYSYDMALNPLTYADFNHNNPVHYNGEIWASTLWDLNWKLIDKYGFSSDIKSGSGGNNLAMQLVMDALKIQSINPTFLEARDAILAADIALTDGANQSLIWEVFARRGMGYSAYDGGSAYALGTPAFDVPSPVGTVSLDKELYLPGDNITITVNDGSFTSSTVTVEVTTNSGDREQVVLNLQAKGGYRGTLATSRGSLQRGNGTLDLTPGDDIVVTYVDANTTTSTTAVPGIVYATAGALNRTFEADFEDGSGNSSLDGLTINNTPPSSNYAPGFWHLSSGRGTETGHSSTYSLYYGHGESATGGGTYDGPQPTQGEVVTPPVVIPPSAKLNFSYLLGRETNRGRADYFSVLISTSGGPYRMMVEKVPVTLGKFQTMSLDLTEHTGETATFKFLVNTVDAQENFHEGWYLDDVVVTNVIDGDDQISEASTIRGNSSVLGSLGNTTGFYIGDVDLYRVDVQAGSTYQFNFDSLAANLDGTLRLFDASGNQLAISYDNAAPGETAGTDPYLSYTFSTAGAYYIGVSGSTNASYNPVTGNGDSDGSKGLYRLSVSGTPGDPDDQITETVPALIPGTVNGSLDTNAIIDAADVDLYRLDVHAGQKLSFNANSSFDSYFRLFDSQGREIAWNDNAAAPGELSSLDAYLAYTFTNAGRYYLGLSAATNKGFNPITGIDDVAGAGGTYQIIMQDLGPQFANFNNNVLFRPDAAPVTVFPSLTITDLDSPNFDGGMLSVIIANSLSGDQLLVNPGSGYSQNGSDYLFQSTIFGTRNPSTGKIHLNAQATQAIVQGFLRSLTFTSNLRDLTPRTIQVTLNDGDGATSATISKEIQIHNGNKDPIVRGFDKPITQTENSVPVLLDDKAIVTDQDSADFANGQLTVKLIANAQSADQISIRNSGNRDRQVLFTGNQVSIGGHVIGTVTGGTGSIPLVITFNSLATQARVQLLIRSLTFNHTSDNPSPLPKTISVTLTDGDSGTSTPLTQTITVKPVNDAPVIAGLSSTKTYLENTPPLILNSTATISDIDSLDFKGGSLTIAQTNSAEATDLLSIKNGGSGATLVSTSANQVSIGGITIGTFTGGNGKTALIITLNEQATPQRVQTLLRSIAFSSSSDNPSTAARTLQISVSDGDGATSTISKMLVNVSPVNDAPTITNFNTSINYVENTPPLLLDTRTVITDIDSANLGGGILTLRLSGGVQATDLLSIQKTGTGNNQITISGNQIRYGRSVIATFTGGSGSTPLVINLTNEATPEKVQALLRSVAFSNSSDTPSTTARTVSVTLTDGDGGTSQLVSKSITLTAANDSPQLSNFGSAVSYTENAQPTLISPSVMITDADSANLSGGQLIIRLTNAPQTSDILSIRTIGTGTTRVTTSGSNVSVGNILIGVFTGGSNGAELKITLNGNATTSRVQSLLQAIAFNNTSENPTSTKRTVEVILTDGDGGTSAVSSKSISVIPVNDSPVISNFRSNITYRRNTPPVLIASSASLVSDVDSPDFSEGKLTITLSSNSPTTDQLLIASQGTGASKVAVQGRRVSIGGIVIGMTTGGASGKPLIIEFNSDATPARVQTLLKSIAFQAKSTPTPGPARTINVSLTDGDGGSTTNLVSVSIA